ncbi:MAG: hypothetical protein Fur0016_16220 [Anaerolineales bacterium]
MRRIFPIINAVIAIGAGLIVLIGYFVDMQGMMEFRLLLFQWAVIVGGVAVLVGIWNLFSVHLQKIRAKKPGSIYSLVLLFFLLLTLFLLIFPLSLQGLVSDDLNQTSTVNVANAIILDGIIIPVEVSLMAVLAVTLIVAAIRMLRTRASLSAVVFLATAFVALLGIGLRSFLGQIPVLSDLAQSQVVNNALALGGARGILIGIALGTLTTGLRILLGVDRPYGGK